MSVKLAACLIVKGTDDEADHLRRCLDSVAAHVDGVFLYINHPKGQKVAPKIKKIATAFGATTEIAEWHNNFAEARNANFAMVPEDYTHVVWLDTDDTIDNPEKLRQVATISERYDAIYADYLYEKDEYGNPVTVHMVARLLKNNGSHVWKGRIHETLVETRNVSQGATKDFTIIHHSDPERRARSHQRNIDLLKLELEDEGHTPDPRTLYYLGSTYIEAGENDNAKQLLNAYLELSGWDQERCMAHLKLGRLYLEEGDRAQAKYHFLMAHGESPEETEPRIELGSLELEIKQYHKARRWLEPVLTMEPSSSPLEQNPMSYTFRTYLLLAETYLGLGGSYLGKAQEFARKALKYKKKDKHLKEYVEIIENINSNKHLTESALELVKALKSNKEEDKVQNLVNSLPKQLEDNPIIVRLRNQDSFTWPEKSIVIMCGDTAIDAWGPWSLEEGIGGSEEAVIRLGRQLHNLGYKVVVYAKPGDRAGEYDGVMYRNFWEANYKDNFDVFVAWRAPFMFDMEIKARKKYLWLHDVMEPGEFTPSRLANIDKVIVLSQYHRELFPMIPEEKIMMSGNGIDPLDFEMYDGLIERDPHKVFYGSSHVRGLAYLYDIWPEVREAVPDATLDVYYGRESYDAINGGNPERLKWMDNMMLKARELDGVTDHGKISQQEIVKRMFQSGVWAYPCPFPEIYCITAIKAQAAGAVPVSSNYAALDETVQFGYKQNFGEFDTKGLELYKQKLIWWLKHPKEQEKIRYEMQYWARQNSWEVIAMGWDDEFRS